MRAEGEKKTLRGISMQDCCWLSLIPVKHSERRSIEFSCSSLAQVADREYSCSTHQYSHLLMTSQVERRWFLLSWGQMFMLSDRRTPHRCLKGKANVCEPSFSSSLTSQPITGFRPELRRTSEPCCSVSEIYSELSSAAFMLSLQLSILTL